MRMAFGLVGLLVTIGVIAWFMHAIYLPDVHASLAAQKKAETMVDQLNGQDANGVKIENAYSVFADMRDDNKLQDLQVTKVMAGGPMELKYGLKTNDVIIAAIDGHTVRTDLNGLNSEQDGMDAVRDSYTTDGQLIVQRGGATLTLPLPKSALMQQPVTPPPAATPPAQPALTPQQQQTAQKTEKQQEGKANNGQTDGTMDEIHQRLHALPTY
jgi:hypothetical protein